MLIVAVYFTLLYVPYTCHSLKSAVEPRDILVAMETISIYYTSFDKGSPTGKDETVFFSCRCTHRPACRQTDQLCSCSNCSGYGSTSADNKTLLFKRTASAHALLFSKRQTSLSLSEEVTIILSSKSKLVAFFIGLLLFTNCCSMHKRAVWGNRTEISPFPHSNCEFLSNFFFFPNLTCSDKHTRSCFQTERTYYCRAIQEYYKAMFSKSTTLILQSQHW